MIEIYEYIHGIFERRLFLHCSKEQAFENIYANNLYKKNEDRCYMMFADGKLQNEYYKWKRQTKENK